MAPHGTTTDTRPLHHERDEQTRDLFRALQPQPDRQSAQRIVDQIVELYLPLADGIARRYRNKGVEVDDLVQVARLALVKAVTRYDVDTGGAFAAFAVPTISGEIKRYFRDHGWMVRPSRRVQELRITARSCRLRLEQGSATPPRKPSSPKRWASLRKLDEADANDSSFRPLSIDAPGGPSEGMSLAGAVAVPDLDLEHVCDHVALSDALSGLDERTRQVLRLRFVEEKTQRCIAEQLGASQMQVSRLLKRTLESLRECLGDEESGVLAEQRAS